MILAFLTRYAGAIMFSIIVGGVFVYWHNLESYKKDAEAARVQMQTQLITAQTANQANQARFDELQALNAKQLALLQNAVDNSHQISIKYDTALNNIAAQRPPKDCKAAVKWFVTTKEDLAWPK